VASESQSPAYSLRSAPRESTGAIGVFGNIFAAGMIGTKLLDELRGANYNQVRPTLRLVDDLRRLLWNLNTRSRHDLQQPSLLSRFACRARWIDSIILLAAVLTWQVMSPRRTKSAPFWPTPLSPTLFQSTLFLSTRSVVFR
jgi:hypothetical protein